MYIEFLISTESQRYMTKFAMMRKVKVLLPGFLS